MVEMQGKWLESGSFFPLIQHHLAVVGRVTVKFPHESIPKEAFIVERLLGSVTGGCKHHKIPGYRATGTTGGCLTVGNQGVG